MKRLPLALFLLPGLLAAQEPPMRIDTEVLAPGLWVFRGFTNGNVLAAEGPNGVLLVDAQSAKRVAALDSALRRVTTRPVRWVVNTHYHEDHTGGNAHFVAQGARVLAHANVSVQAAKDTTIPALDWHRTPLPAAAMPTDHFTDRQVLRAGNDSVVVRHPGPAHTDGDAIIHLPAHDVIHVGDILEVGAPPFVDWWAGGSLDGMIGAIDRLLPMVGQSTRLVPGHGPTVRRSDLVSYREMLHTVQSRVRAGLTRGTPAEALAAESVAGFEQQLGGERRARQFGAQVVQGLGRRP